MRGTERFRRRVPVPRPTRKAWLNNRTIEKASMSQWTLERGPYSRHHTLLTIVLTRINDVDFRHHLASIPSACACVEPRFIGCRRARDIQENSDADDRQLRVSFNVSIYRFLLPHIIAILGDESSAPMHANDMMGFGQVFQELGRYPRAASVFEG